MNAPTWEQRLAAIQAIGDASLRMRHPGDWYVAQIGVEVAVNGMLEGRYGNGATPEAAVLDHWKKITDLGAGAVVTLNAMRENRRAVRWNGFMWIDA